MIDLNSQFLDNLYVANVMSGEIYYFPVHLSLIF